MERSSLKRGLISLLLAPVLLGFGAPQDSTLPSESSIAGVPEFIKAGEVLQFTIKLDRAPNFDGGSIQYSVGDSSTGFPVNAGQSEIHISWRIPATAPRGKWTIHISGFFTGMGHIPLKSADVSFEVIPNENLIYPSAAEIKINPSQVQLFRSASLALQQQVQSFKATLSRDLQSSPLSVHGAIEQNVEKALGALEKTQSAFRDLGVKGEQEQGERVFFDDIRLSYNAVLKAIAAESAEEGPIKTETRLPDLVLAVTQRNVSQSNYSIVAQAALRPFEQNELAYNLAADTESLTFDLTVKSSPEGASVCYHRRGDPCHSNPDPTDTVLKSLPLAIWIVRFQKLGYKSEEREHDPFREPNHVITVDLKP